MVTRTVAWNIVRHWQYQAIRDTYNHAHHACCQLLPPTKPEIILNIGSAANKFIMFLWNDDSVFGISSSMCLAGYDMFI